MTAQIRDLAIAVWRVSEIAEALKPGDLTDLSIAPVLLHLEIVTAELAARRDAMEGHDVVL